jgi:hypothetical protein
MPVDPFESPVVIAYFAAVAYVPVSILVGAVISSAREVLFRDSDPWARRVRDMEGQQRQSPPRPPRRYKRLENTVLLPYGSTPPVRASRDAGNAVATGELTSRDAFWLSGAALRERGCDIAQAEIQRRALKRAALRAAKRQTAMHPAARVAYALCGEDHPNAKLTWEKVGWMRTMAANGTSSAELGRLFRVSQTTAWNVVNGKT